jgi:hypothetical protein
MLTGAHKTQRMSSALTFLEPYYKDGNEFLNHIILVIGKETWVFICESWNQRVVKAVDAYTYTKQAEKV